MKQLIKKTFSKLSRNAKNQVRRYWENHNVTLHKQFSSPEESLNFFEWRNSQYPGYIELAPVNNADDLVVLDFGCGPGHDLIGFGAFSKPKRLIGADVSRVSLSESQDRLNLHKIEAELITIDPQLQTLPLESSSIDYIHCSGVLHHTDNELNILKEFRRVLRPGGEARIMVYNYNSLWVHLYTAYIKQILDESFQNLSLREAFAKTTDGVDCPISRCYTPSEFCSIANQAGFKATHIGNSMSLTELNLLPKIYQAIQNIKLSSESRKFLTELTFNEKNHPIYRGQLAGINSVYSLIS